MLQHFQYSHTTTTKEKKRKVFLLGGHQKSFQQTLQHDLLNYQMSLESILQYLDKVQPHWVAGMCTDSFFLIDS